MTFAATEEGEAGGNLSVAAPARQVFYLLLQAVGRTPKSTERAGVAVTDRGSITVDIKIRINLHHIFAIGEVVSHPMLAPKAVHETHVAAVVVAGGVQSNKELTAKEFNAVSSPAI